MTRLKKKDKPCLLIDTFRCFYENALRSMAWGLTDNHYNDVIMSAMASQITGVLIVYLTVSSGADQIKHQSFASLAFVRGIHRWQENSPHKGPVTRKMFPFDDVIMKSTLDQLMAWCRQVTNPLLEPILGQIYIAVGRHLGITPLTDMSKLLCATPDIDICMTVFISIYKWQYGTNYLTNYCRN